MSHKINIFSPVTGITIPLEEIPDEVFSMGLMGPGLAIALDGSDWNVYAPADAQVSVVFPTAHAVVLKHLEGIEMLIHIGIDTFKKHDAFEKHITENQQVVKGQMLISIDEECFREERLLVLFTLINGKQFAFEKKDKNFVTANKTILFNIH